MLTPRQLVEFYSLLCKTQQRLNQASSKIDILINMDSFVLGFAIALGYNIPDAMQIQKYVKQLGYGA